MRTCARREEEEEEEEDSKKQVVEKDVEAEGVRGTSWGYPGGCWCRPVPSSGLLGGFLGGLLGSSWVVSGVLLIKLPGRVLGFLL